MALQFPTVHRPVMREVLPSSGMLTEAHLASLQLLPPSEALTFRETVINKQLHILAGACVQASKHVHRSDGMESACADHQAILCTS